MTTTGSPLWTVAAEFTSRDDAVAFMDLARELGYLSHLSSRSINEREGSGTRPVRETRLGRRLLQSMLPNRTYDYEHFRAVCEEGQYAAQSASPILSRLVDQGDIVREERGQFRLAQSILLCGGCETPAECGAKRWCRTGEHPLPSVP